MKFKNINIALVVFVCTSGFAAEEYAGGQLPIVFAGPQTFIHDYKKDAHELIDGRFLGTDPFTGKVDVQYLYPIYDAGAPKLVTSILIQGGNDTDYYNTDRLNNFCVYGSNDKENWTIFWEGHGHTISRDWIFRVIRNPETGESKAYKLECKAVPTMSTAEDLGTFDDSAYPIAERYRYYRIEPSPTAGFKTVNASEFSLWTSDLVVAGNRPTVYGNAEEMGTADDSEGVTFSGTLTYAPAGTADIYVAIHEGEFGADLEAWESNGAQIIKLAEGVASGAAFSVKVPGFNCGVYNSRIFAISGDDVAASPCSYGFAVDMEARYPKTYYSAWNNDGDVHLMYDGNMDTYVDRDGAHQTVFVFDLSELKKEGMVPTAIRFWPRKGTLNVEKIRTHCSYFYNLR